MDLKEFGLLRDAYEQCLASKEMIESVCAYEGIIITDHKGILMLMRYTQFLKLKAEEVIGYANLYEELLIELEPKTRVLLLGFHLFTCISVISRCT